jgi:hypothetical protein
MDGDLDGKAA